MSKKQSEDINLNIGPKVLSHLGIPDALKEIISNGIDEHIDKQITKDIKVLKKGKKWIIRDFGNGLTKKAFVYNINKEGENQIGLFGYGLKDALGILNSNDVKVEIVTQKYRFTPKMKEIVGDDGPITTLHVNITPNTTKTLEEDVGTEFIFTNLEDEDMFKAKEKFVHFIKPTILHKTDIGEVFLNDGNQSLYYNGVNVYDTTGFHFSYNLYSNPEIDKLLNRDRKQIELLLIKKIITKMWKNYPLYDNETGEVNNYEIFEKINEICECDIDALQEFNNIEILRNLIKQINESNNYVFVGNNEKISKKMQLSIEKNNRESYVLGDGIKKKFNVKSIKSLYKKPLFYGNTYDDTTTIPIHTLMYYSSQKENKDYIIQIINNAITNISKIIQIPDNIKQKFQNIEIIDDKENNDENDSDSDSDDDNHETVYKDGYDFSDDNIKITEKFANNHNKLIGAIYYYIITNYDDDKQVLFDKLGTSISNVNKKSWFSW